MFYFILYEQLEGMREEKASNEQQKNKKNQELKATRQSN